MSPGSSDVPLDEAFAPLAPLLPLAPSTPPLLELSLLASLDVHATPSARAKVATTAAEEKKKLLGLRRIS